MTTARFGSSPEYTKEQLRNSMERAKVRRLEFEESGKRKRNMTQTDALDHALTVLVAFEGPMTVRGAFYRAVSFGAVPKTDKDTKDTSGRQVPNGYDWVQSALARLRKTGKVSYDGIVDASRRVQQLTSSVSPRHAIDGLVRNYRRDIWMDQDCDIYIVVEKDALVGVVRGEVNRYQANLCAAKGYSSLTLTNDLHEYINEDKITLFYQLGDHDPSGADAWRSFEQAVRDRLDATGKDDADVRFERLAVTPAQISEFSLSTRPSKTEDARYKKWHTAEVAAGRDGESVDVDAIPPNELRALVRQAIEDNLDREAYEATIAQQAEDVAWLESVIRV